MLANKMQDFRNYVLHNFIVIFDAEQVYLQPKVTNVKRRFIHPAAREGDQAACAHTTRAPNKEVTANPEPQTLQKTWFFENPKPLTPNPKPGGKP